MFLRRSGDRSADKCGEWPRSQTGIIVRRLCQSLLPIAAGALLSSSAFTVLPTSFSLLSLRPPPALLVYLRNLECSVKSREKRPRGTFTSTTLVFHTLFVPSLALFNYCAANAFRGSDYSFAGLIRLLCVDNRI